MPNSSPPKVIKFVDREVVREVKVEVVKEVPKEVIKYVDREIIKEVKVEVIKEVKVEVIKEVKVEVPKEVIVYVEKPVEVIKEVPVERIREVYINREVRPNHRLGSMSLRPLSDWCPDHGKLICRNTSAALSLVSHVTASKKLVGILPYLHPVAGACRARGDARDTGGGAQGGSRRNYQGSSCGTWQAASQESPRE